LIRIWTHCAKGLTPFGMSNHFTVGKAAALLLISLSVLSCATTASLEPEPDLSRKSSGRANSNASSINGFTHFLDETGSLPIEIHIVGKARDIEFVEDAMGSVAQMYRQCDIPIKAKVHNLEEIPPQDVDVHERYRLTEEYSVRKPSVFIIESSAERSVGFSYIPKLQRDVSGTAWITDRVSDSCFAWIIAHEIGHIVLNNGGHHPQTSNIMNARCSASSNYNRRIGLPRWTENQCEIMRSRRDQ